MDVRNVIIVGGGIAGLSAAAELLRRGAKVTLLEARERVGGRMHTVYDGAVPIELGAEFLHGQTRSMRRALKRYHLATVPVPDRHRILTEDRREAVNFSAQTDQLISRVDPQQPDQPFSRFLDGQDTSDLERRLAIAFMEGFNAARVDRISAHAVFRAQLAAERMESTDQRRLKEGYAVLASRIESEIRNGGGEILTGTAVRKVQWKPGGVQMVGQTASGLQTFSGTAAIITLPLGVFKAGAVKFVPPLDRKREAIEGLEFGNVIRVTLLFRESWWLDGDFGFIHALDEPLPTWWSDSRGPILTGWAGGPKADALRDLSEAQLEGMALEILGRIFFPHPAALRSQLVSSHMHNWATDPFALGAYSYIPVNGLDLPRLLAAPVGNTLFFAGEATVDDAQTGTVTGAFETGLRAAREVVG